MRRSRAGILAGQVHGQDDVLEQRQRRQQLEELEDDADALAAPACQPVLAQLVHRLAQHHHLACGGAVDAGDHIEQGGLAAAGGTDDGDKLAGIHLQGNALEDFDLAAAHGIALDDVAQFDHWFGEVRRLHTRESGCCACPCSNFVTC